MRTILLAICCVLLIIAGITSFLSYKDSFTLVTIAPLDNTTITVYKSTSASEGNSYDKNDPILTSEGSGASKKLKQGSYVYTVTPKDSAYENQEMGIDVDEDPITITATLHFTKAKLATIALEKKPKIENLLNTEYAAVMNDYSVGNVEAYQDGNWLGVRINPKRAGGDTFICVIKDENGTLTIATDTPALTIPVSAYPKVPKDIIINTNLLVRDLQS